MSSLGPFVKFFEDFKTIFCIFRARRCRSYRTTWGRYNGTWRTMKERWKTSQRRSGRMKRVCPRPLSIYLSIYLCHSIYLSHYTTDQDSSLCPCSMQHYKVLLSILSLNILEHSLRNVFFQSIEKTFDIWWNIGMTFILFSRSENEMFLSNYICF